MSVKIKSWGAKSLTVSPAGIADKILLIRTVAGPEIGFGHLKRSLILARHLRQSMRPVFLLNAEDVWSKEQVWLHGYEFARFCRHRPLPVRMEVAGLVIDTRRRVGLMPLLAEARKRGIPVASIHDLGLAPLPSDVVIDGSIRPGNKPASAGAVCFWGTKYLILDDLCAHYHRKTKVIGPRIHKVVINLGGGDAKRYFIGILHGLHASGLELEVIGFPGFCSWGQEELTGTDWGRVRFRWLLPDEAPAEAIFSADLVISAGGLSAYEALCAGTPVCALAYDAHQQLTIGSLARRGAAVNLGRGTELDPASMGSLILRLTEDDGLRRLLSNCGRALVDGKGACRVARILRRMIHDGGPVDSHCRRRPLESVSVVQEGR